MARQFSTQTHTRTRPSNQIPIKFVIFYMCKCNMTLTRKSTATAEWQKKNGLHTLKPSNFIGTIKVNHYEMSRRWGENDIQNGAKVVKASRIPIELLAGMAYFFFCHFLPLFPLFFVCLSVFFLTRSVGIQQVLTYFIVVK